MSSKSKNKWEYMLFSTLGKSASKGSPEFVTVPGTVASRIKASGPSPAMISVRRRVSSVSRSSVLLGSTKNSYSVSTPVAFR